MNRKIVLVLILLVIFIHPYGYGQEQEGVQQNLPSVELVVQDYLQAIGGAMSLQSIETVSIEADFNGMDQWGDGKVFVYFQDDLWHYDFQLEDSRYTYHCCPDGTGWRSLDGPTEMSTNDRIRFNEIVPVVVTPLKWLEYDGEIEVKGIEKVNEEDCYHLEFRPKDGDPVQRYFDCQTGLLTKMSYRSGSDIDWLLSDYQNVDGVMVPMFRKQFFDGEIGYTVKTTKVVFDKEIDPELFQPPSDVATID